MDGLTVDEFAVLSGPSYARESVSFPTSRDAEARGGCPGLSEWCGECGDGHGGEAERPCGRRERCSAGGNTHNLAGAELPQQRGPRIQSVAAAAGRRIVEAYAAGLGRPVLNGTRTKLER